MDTAAAHADVGQEAGQPRVAHGTAAGCDERLNAGALRSIWAIAARARGRGYCFGAEADASPAGPRCSTALSALCPSEVWISSAHVHFSPVLGFRPSVERGCGSGRTEAAYFDS